MTLLRRLWRWLRGPRVIKIEARLGPDGILVLDRHVQVGDQVRVTYTYKARGGG